MNAGEEGRRGKVGRHELLGRPKGKNSFQKHDSKRRQGKTRKVKIGKREVRRPQLKSLVGGQ